jgi:hypothetical protein
MNRLTLPVSLFPSHSAIAGDARPVISNWNSWACTSSIEAIISIGVDMKTYILFVPHMTPVLLARSLFVSLLP